MHMWVWQRPGRGGCWVEVVNGEKKRSPVILLTIKIH